MEQTTRTNKVPYLIIFEGQDRTGKDTMINFLKDDLGLDVIIYRQETCQEAGVDYRNKEEFEAYLNGAFAKTYMDIMKLHQKYPDRLIVTSRLWISDEVYSKMFGRRPIADEYKDLFMNDFDGNVLNIVMLWNSWTDFIERMKKIGDEDSLHEYSAEEFEKVKLLFFNRAKVNDDPIIWVRNSDSREDLYKQVQNILASLF